MQAWLTGVNPELGDRVPLRLMRDNEFDAVSPAILSAARAFLAGGVGRKDNVPNGNQLSTGREFGALSRYSTMRRLPIPIRPESPKSFSVRSLPSSCKLTTSEHTVKKS